MRLREHIRLSTPRSLVSALDEAERVEHILCATETRHRIRQVEMSEDEEELELTRQASANPPQRSWRGPKRAARNEGCYRCGEHLQELPGSGAPCTFRLCPNTTTSP